MCYKKYVENRPDNEKCPFCDIENKFKTTFFDMKDGEQNCDSWIDYEMKDSEEFLWYAVLAGSQFTRGHTLVILGCHMDQITEDITKSDNIKPKLDSMMIGINTLANRLKNKLEGVESIHALCLCEGERTHHLHFHLIPRYKYEKDERRFFGYFYGQRAKKVNMSESFEKSFIEGKIHGIWHDAYKEMHFVDTEFFNSPLQQRQQDLKKLAKRLRTKEPPKIFFE
ncbi:MAG: HIT family protein [Candidatus Odinarchaeota archaeon]